MSALRPEPPDAPDSAPVQTPGLPLDGVSTGSDGRLPGVYDTSGRRVAGPQPHLTERRAPGPWDGNTWAKGRQKP